MARNNFIDSIKGYHFNSAIQDELTSPMLNTLSYWRDSIADNKSVTTRAIDVATILAENTALKRKVKKLEEEFNELLKEMREC